MFLYFQKADSDGIVCNEMDVEQFLSAVKNVMKKLKSTQ